MKRLASCADCGASVVLTSAAPVIRAGAVVLLCEACRGRAAGGRDSGVVAGAAAEEDSSDYDAIAISGEDSSEYDAISISGDGGDEPPAEAERGLVIDSSIGDSVSGSIDPEAADRRGTEAPEGDRKRR